MYRNTFASLVPNSTNTRGTAAKAMLGVVFGGLLVLTINLGAQVDERSQAEAESWLADVSATAEWVHSAIQAMAKRDAPH